MYFLLGFFPEAKIYFQIRQPRPDSSRSFFLLQILPVRPGEEEIEKAAFLQTVYPKALPHPAK